MAASVSSSRGTGDNGSVPVPSTSLITSWKYVIAPVLAGSGAGACGILVGHPFDSLKVRMQVAKNLAAPKLDLATVKQLYRGMMPPLITAGFLQAFLFSTYEACKKVVTPFVTSSREVRSKDVKHANRMAPSPAHGEVFATDIDTKKDVITSRQSGNAVAVSSAGQIYGTSSGKGLRYPLHRRHYEDQYDAEVSDLVSQDVSDHLRVTFWGGTLSGFILSVISTPIQVVKIQQQVATTTNIRGTIQHCYNTAGWRCFYRAYTSMLVLEGPGRGVYFGVYEAMKIVINNYKYRMRDGHTVDNNGEYLHTLELIQPAYTPDFQEERGTRMLAASTAGVTSWIFAYPFDVIKSRMQLDFNRNMYTSTWQCFRDTYMEGGLKALYRGIGYTIVRAAPVAATILPIYESVKEYLERNL